MSGLARIDLSRAGLDARSFLGRAAALGIEHGRLPSSFMEGLMAWLRLRGLELARSQRTGIRMERSGLERGVRQGLVCVDLGLEEEARGDVERAVELLGGGDFEDLRRCGWERAFERLERMRKEAAQWKKRPALAFLAESREEVEAWAGLVPETWEGAGGEGVDPRKDWEEFLRVGARLAFVDSLPPEPLAGLLEREPEGLPFGDFLRRLVLAAALGREELHVDRRVVKRFARQCLDGGRLRQEVRERVLGLMRAHLEGTLEEGQVGFLLEEVEVALEEVEKCGPERLEELFLPLEKWDNAGRARAAARADMEAFKEAGEEGR